MKQEWNPDDIGWRMRIIRERRGISQGQMATYAGVSSMKISYFERDRQDIGLKVFVRMCAALSIHPGDFFPDDVDEIRAGVGIKEEELK